jgi:3-oxoacyl-[acyl-carrier protein] reductase
MASWSKTLSKELPPCITINNVLPGFTNTERLTELKETLSEQKGISQDEVESAWLSTVPEGRLADPSELGQVIAFLASPAASFVRGVSLPVDGGRTGSI